MTPQEAQIIKDVFARLKAMGPAPADAEAAGLVEAQLGADRSSGLALVQALVMTDRQCGQLAQENQALKQRLQTLEAQGTQPQSGGLFGQPAPVVPQPGPWDRAPQPQAQPPMAPQPGPWGGAQQSGPWGAQPEPPQGGGFWSSALRTGAGVAGGMFAFEALRSVFGGSHGGGFGGGGYGGGSGLFGQPTTVINETTIYENDRTSGAPGPVADAGYSSGGFLDDSSYDGGSDFDDDNTA